MVFLSFILGIVVLLFLITLHELGHFLMAKIFKVYIYEFSIGIGPKLISWAGKETKYSIRLLPFGGYISTASELLDPPDNMKNIEIDKKRYIEGINRGKRLLIILSGVLTNLLIALTMFTSIFLISGYSPNDLHGYGAMYYTEENSPSKILGLNNDDKKNPDIIYKIWFVNFYYNKTVISIKSNTNNTIKFNEGHSLKDLKSKDGEQVYSVISPSLANPLNFYNSAMVINKFLSFNKDDNQHKNVIFVQTGIYNHKTKNVTLQPVSKITYGYFFDKKTPFIMKNHYIIGMKAPDFYFSSSLSAYLYGWKKTFYESGSILRSFGKIFTGQFSELSGPIGAFEQTKNYIKSGPTSFFIYVAILSSNLFVLNLIPIPPLDGFRFFEVFIEMCIRRELNSKLKLIVTVIGISLFMFLFIGLTLKDLFI